MNYSQFVWFNVAGGIGWVFSMTICGYLLGNIPFVKTHFEKIVIGIIVVSVSDCVSRRAALVGERRGCEKRRYARRRLASRSFAHRAIRGRQAVAVNDLMKRNFPLAYAIGKVNLEL